MCDSKLNENEVAEETFKLLLNAFSMRNRQFNRVSAERLKQFKSHQKKCYILFCINNTKNCTLSDLEKMMLENRSTASAAVSRLYREGYIDKSHPEKSDDGRKVYFRITEKGKEILDGFYEFFTNDVKDFYSGLSDEKKQYFLNGIVSLNKVFG